MTGQFVPVKLDAEKEGKAVAAKYGVQGYPTILFINETGEVEGKIGGYMPPKGFSDQLQSISEAHRDFPKLQARYKAHPDDVEAAGKLAAIYAGRGDSKHAMTLLEAAEKLDPKNSKDYLTKAYNALADMHQEKQEFDQAIPLFQKAAKTGKKPSDVAYAQLSTAVCYISQQKPEAAVKPLKAVIALEGVSKEDKEQAEQMLKQVQQALDKKQ